MCVDTSVPGRARERLVVLIGNVFSRLWVSVALGESIVDDVDDILLLAMANEKVVWLHVPVDEVVIVEELQSLDHLVRYHQRRLYCEFAFAVVEQVLQRGAEQVHDHCVVVSLDAEPVDLRDASYKK